METVFYYDKDILEQFAGLSGGFILGQGMQNSPSPEALEQAYLLEQQSVLARIGDTPLSEIESLAAWRAAFRQFGVDPTKYRSAAEALLRRLTKKGDIPSINALVDICNLVSIRYAIPIAAMDRRAIEGAVRVQFARGDERFVELDREAFVFPEPGEVIFTDESKMVVARRWCWRQSNHSAAQVETSHAVITIEAQHSRSRQDVQAACEDLLALLRLYVGGDYRYDFLDANKTAFEVGD